MIQRKHWSGGLIFIFLLMGAACQPQATINESETVQALGEETVEVATSTPTESTLATDSQVTAMTTITPKPTAPLDGPWLVYPAPDGSGLHAFDEDGGGILEILLPEPVYTGDLVNGLSPDGSTLVLRAGAPENVDEFALYQIWLPSGQVTKLTPLLSISLQREIVNGEDEQVLAAFSTVTRPDGVAWSPDGRYLAFTAALDGSSSDLYVYDVERDRIERLNGLFTQSASPSWAPESNWLAHQEIYRAASEADWRSEVVEVISVPGYADQYALYVPGSQSQNEVLLGWINAQSLISYTDTQDGSEILRQVNVNTLAMGVRFQGSFEGVAFDPDSGCLALILGDEDAAALALMSGVYLLSIDSTIPALQRGGHWDDVRWDPSGMFIAAGSQGVFIFSPDGEGVILRDENDLEISPSGNWMIAWGDGLETNSGARLYQSQSGNLLQQITDQIVTSVYWLPDSQTFFIQAEGALYHLSFPELSMKEIERGFSLEESLTFIWVE